LAADDLLCVAFRVALSPPNLNFEETDSVAEKDWSEAVEDAVRRHAASTGSSTFTRRALIEAELSRIVDETGSSGATPDMTLSRELQELRDEGVLEFVERGTYRLIE
jgi:putative restriction endonuclease